ncbi:hypothetical protein PPL_02334 [Heterostelium album PN500]|uniref:Carbohydrate binding domain-containing protein n=1 Tax=Heterostelium pallidum (strain ATCC 26659 / Pp 5 / PN500) TaxID=670386 RepID=D3B208_HETP5|nr:hypothetical protein PPL_02334 [Heterostelium album PN500]EFA85332.1 hypothetical protein PPL_02334 [Heterostelium album PN500]|eukprot:XP_020437441.1 hypothetical protein PPL_02334 [Heterostelium album PN500]
MKYIILITLFIIYNIYFVNGQCDFSKIVQKYYASPSAPSGFIVGMRVVITKNNGDIYYLSGKSLSAQSFSTGLANVDAFIGVSTRDNACLNGVSQPFEATAAKITFFDARSFTISPTGFVTFYASQTGNGLEPALFNITTCTSNILHGLDDKGNSYTFYLQLGEYPNRIGGKCLTLSVSQKIMSNWMEGPTNVYQTNVNFTNTGTSPVQSQDLVVSFDESKVRNYWGLDKISTNNFKLPAYQTAIQPNQQYSWGYVSTTANIDIKINGLSLNA